MFESCRDRFFFLYIKIPEIDLNIPVTLTGSVFFSALKNSDFGMEDFFRVIERRFFSFLSVIIFVFFSRTQKNFGEICILQLVQTDVITFGLFILLILGISIFASRKKESNEEDYFLAGRKLTWWTIGLSLIASNISTEHFVGMAGRGHAIGLAIASYEWMAAVTLILVSAIFLPRFMALKIYTIPQYLEHRFGSKVRVIMACMMLLAYIFVTLASVLYSGAVTLQTIFGMNLTVGIWSIGLLAGLYTIYGGLQAVVWSDVVQGVTLLIGGALVTWFGVQELGGWSVFWELSSDQMHTVMPWDHPEMPWVAVFIGGLWIPNIFYWGLNQFICQRTLGAKSLDEGQKGILFAAFIKLFIPFIMIFPGIIAFHLYGNKIDSSDMAYPFMINHILPVGLRGIMLAALFGAVMSTLDSVINSASTIFTIDLYKKFRPNTSPLDLVKIGRYSTAFFVVFGCLWAPVIAGQGSVFQYIQMFWGFVTPGLVACFLFGFFTVSTPQGAAILGMGLNIPV